MPLCMCARIEWQVGGFHREQGLLSLSGSAGVATDFTPKDSADPSHVSSCGADWTRNWSVVPSRKAVQAKQDLLVQAESISNKDYAFQCLLPCFDCGNKEKQFLITNNPSHALLTDYFVQIVGTCRGLQPPCTKYSSLLLIIKKLVISCFVRRVFLRQGSPPYEGNKSPKCSSVLKLQ